MEQEEEEARRKRARGLRPATGRLLALALLFWVLGSAPDICGRLAGRASSHTGPLCLTRAPFGRPLLAAASEQAPAVAIVSSAANTSDLSPAQIHNRRRNEINKGEAPSPAGEPAPEPPTQRPNNNPTESSGSLGSGRRTPTEAVSGQAGAWQQQEQTMMNDVLCNSRCECLQLQFSRRPRADKSGHEQARELHLGHQHRTPSDGRDAPVAPAPAAKQADLNQIALIEFGQDYSFDDAPAGASSLDELAESADDRAAAGGQSLELPAGRAPQEADETGSGAASPPPPLMWLPPSLQLDGTMGSAAPASNQLARLDEVGAGSGNRATIKMAPRSLGPVGGDQSSGSGRASARQKAAALMDPLNPSFITLPAGSLGRNLTAGVPRPLNGHALLLPSFKQKAKKSQQASAFDFGRHQAAAGRPLLAASDPETSPAAASEEDNELVLERIAPLRSVSLADRKLGDLSAKQLEFERETNLTQLLIDSLTAIDRERVQSLSLRQNNIKFELWTQLYSLLLAPMRTQLHRLDLSHNALVKLGVTFTGYIEHHFVYQLVKSNGSDVGWTWPFSMLPPSFQTSSKASDMAPANAQQSKVNASEPVATMAQQPSGYMKLLSQFKLSASSTSALPAGSSAGANSKRLFRRPILGDGRVYSAVRLHLPLMKQAAANSSSSLVFYAGSSNEAGSLNSSSAPASYQQIVQLLLHQPAQLKALDLSHNKLKWLINDQFRVLKRLQSLRLDHNRIRFIHQQAFNGLVELKYLNLNFNRLQTIYMEQFQTNYKLLALFVRSNYLTYLRAGSLASLGRLRRLDLARNKLTILSSNAFVGLESLELLNLSANSFVHVPSASFHPLVSSLKQLELSENQLAQLMPGAFFHLEQLEELALNDNSQLAAIDRGAFWDLARLERLSLRSNPQLAEINAQAFVGVPQLKTIQVEDCPLLELQQRQMLENITATNTMRTILKQQQAQMVQEAPGSSNSRTSSSTEPLKKVPTEALNEQQNSTTKLDSSTQKQLDLERPQAHQQLNQKGQNNLNSNKLFVSSDEEQTRYQQQMSIQLQFDEKSATQKITKYFYCLGALAFCVVALKLVFKFSSTRRYLELRRRRRRVYESPCDSSIGGESLAGSSSTCSKGSLNGESVTSRSRTRSCSSASESAFSLVEQQPHNVIKQRQLTASSPANSLPGACRHQDQDPSERQTHVMLEDGSATRSQQMEPERQLDEMSEIDLRSDCASQHYPAECCADCLSQLELAGEPSAHRHQLPCCAQSALDHVGQPPAAYDNDELLRDLAAAAASASGLCGLEHANCTHCYQSVVAHYQPQEVPQSPQTCCDFTAQQQQQQQAECYARECAAGAAQPEVASQQSGGEPESEPPPSASQMEEPNERENEEAELAEPDPK